MTLLELNNISMHFIKKGKFLEAEKHIHVLRNINLKIESGEILVLVGESGCGKTTMGKIITGLLKPTKGELMFNGRNIYKTSIFTKRKQTKQISTDTNLIDGKSYSEKKRYIKEYRKREKQEAKHQIEMFKNSVQFIQQDSYAALNPVKTIFQSLAAPIKNKFPHFSKKQINLKIDEIMDLVGLSPTEQYLKKYPHQLSGGQRQRILIARAISLEPKLIVADEPVSMIDVSLRLSLLDLMKELNAKFNIAFVYITHDLSTARYVAYHGKICIMYLGEIVEMGDVLEVTHNPKHPYTQALFSAVPIPNPVLSRKRNEIKLKSMEIENLMQRNQGCPFYSRCIYAHEDCENDTVELVDYKGSYVKCKYINEVPKWVQKD